jgi:hypothetical protein
MQATSFARPRRIRRTGGLIAGFVSAMLLAACSTFGIRSGTKEPAYEVVASPGEDIEIRRYAERLAADVVVDEADEEEARNAGFRRLAAFIFAKDRPGEPVAMTAPVGQAREGPRIDMTAPVAQADAGAERWRIRFFMPSAYTRQTLPEPLDPGIEIVEVPAQTMAVLRFSGSRAPDAVQAATQRLRHSLQDGAWRPVGAPLAWFYDPPWTLPFLRRNEVAVEVVPRD